MPLSSLTGKMDVFSLALVTMYMYMKYHILVKMVTQGADNYNGYNVTDIQTFHLKLMVQVKSCDSCGSKLVQLFGVNLNYPPPPTSTSFSFFVGGGIEVILWKSARLSIRLPKCL